MDVFWFFLFMYKNLQPKIEFSIHVSASQFLHLFGQRGRNGHEETVAVGKELSRGFGGQEERASGGHPKGLFPMRL